MDIVEDLRMVAPADPWAPVFVTAGVVLVLCVVILIFLVLRRRRKRRDQSLPAIVPPEQAARERLAAIRHLIGDGEDREFVIRVSHILRVYIEECSGLRAPHLSTEEFLFEAERSPLLTENWRTRLGDFLFQCDRVKFALANFESPRLESLYHTAERFIDETVTAAAKDLLPQPSIPPC